jgi:ParB/RepB/Spo0J family partition protein
MELIKLDPNVVVVREGFNPRGVDSFEVNDADMKALINSIKRSGFWSHKPITVKVVDGKYVLIDGHRRLHASLLINIEEVYAVVETKVLDEAEELLMALMSNEGKRLTPLEEAKAFKRLTDANLSARTIAQRVGRSNAHVSNRLKLLSAAPEVNEAVELKLITIQQLQTLLKKFPKDFDSQVEALTELVEEKAIKMREGVEKRRSSREAAEQNGNQATPSSEPEATPEVGQEDTESDTTKQAAKKKYKEAQLYELLDIYVEDYEKCLKEDKDCKYFYAGGIRVLTTLLDITEPVELPL